MSAFDILTWSANNREKRIPSASNVFDFLEIRIGGDNLQISEAGPGAFDFDGNEVQNAAAPTTPNSLATKAYVDAVATGLAVKASVMAASVAALAANTYDNGTDGVGATLTANANGALAAIDGYTPVLGDRLLIKNEGTAANNGIYVVSQVGDGSNPYILTRATDADTCQPAANPKVTSGMHTFIENGTALGGEGWVLVTPDPITLGTTDLDFSQFSQVSSSSYTGGDGIDISSFVISAKIDGDALQFDTGVITLTLDGGTLSAGVSGLKVAAAGITETEIASSALGNGLQGGSGSLISVKLADSSLSLTAAGLFVNPGESRVNDNAGTITLGQVVYVKSNGHVDLANASTQDDKAPLALVSAPTVATTASALMIEKPGTILSAYTGLTVGAPVYLDTTSGGVTQDLSGFTAGNFVWKLGYAVSATALLWDPEFLLEY